MDNWYTAISLLEQNDIHFPYQHQCNHPVLLFLNNGGEDNYGESVAVSCEERKNISLFLISDVTTV